MSLNEVKRKTEQAKREKQLLELENTRRKAKGMPLLTSLEDDNEEESNHEEKEKDVKSSDDGFLVETAHILTDYINLKSETQKTAQQ